MNVPNILINKVKELAISRFPTKQNIFSTMQTFLNNKFKDIYVLKYYL